MSAMDILTRPWGREVLRQVAEHPEGILQAEIVARHIPGASPRNARIRELVSVGLISREDSLLIGPRYRLRITDLGRIYAEGGSEDPDIVALLHEATALHDNLITESRCHNPNQDTHALLCEAAGHVDEAFKLILLARRSNSDAENNQRTGAHGHIRA